MKNYLLILFGFLLFSAMSRSSHAQGFEAPADSNSVVYFVRVTKFAANTLISYFHETKLIGKFRGANYMRYECPAGKNLFWASSMERYFLNCDLKAGGTYIVLINMSDLGFHFEPITIHNQDFERVLAFVKENKCLKMSREKIEEHQAKLDRKGFIDRNLKKYEDKWIDSHLTQSINPDMSIPSSFLK
jgi:hypothetical protein